MASVANTALIKPHTHSLTHSFIVCRNRIECADFNGVRQIFPCSLFTGPFKDYQASSDFIFLENSRAVEAFMKSDCLKHSHDGGPVDDHSLTHSINQSITFGTLDPKIFFSGFSCATIAPFCLSVL